MKKLLLATAVAGLSIAGIGAAQAESGLTVCAEVNVNGDNVVAPVFPEGCQVVEAPAAPELPAP